MIYYSICGEAPKGLWSVRKPASAGFLDGLIDPASLPAWLSAEDLDYYVAQYQRSGFRGPLNWYRNIDRNWEESANLPQQVDHPALMITAELDIVLRPQMAEGMKTWVPDLRNTVLISLSFHFTLP